MRRQEKQKKSKLFLPFFIIGILVLSVFGVMIGGLTQEGGAVKYNGIYFRSSEGGYLFEVGDVQYGILNGPLEVEGFYDDIPSEFLMDLRGSKKLYFDVSDSSAVSMNNLYSNLIRVRPISLACSEEHKDEEQCSDKPIKSCEDFVLRFEVADEKEVSYDGCLVVKGSNGYLNGISDVIVMAYAGVFDE